MKCITLLIILFISTNVFSEDFEKPLQPPTLFAIIDIETTGLNPNFHEIIDIGMIIVDEDLNEIERLYAKVMPEYPNRINPKAREINGFDPIVWKKNGALSDEEAIKNLINFLARFKRKPYFIAFNSWFDSSFLNNLFQKYNYSFENYYDYKVIDIPSIALACGFFPEANNFNDNLANLLNVSPETKNPLLHTGESGVNFNYLILKSLKKKGCFFND